MTQGPSKERISELMEMGYTVHTVCDQPPCLYGWIHPSSGASQGDNKSLQPYRLSAAQAWDDCDDYVSLRVPHISNPDWYSDK